MTREKDYDGEANQEFRRISKTFTMQDSKGKPKVEAQLPEDR